ncbi:ParA family protein [Micromonospora gifhornensis]|uniref:ParA family protein n=1 Tax=Micromonospora gifhornensis TaxID=84594 RepID=UPI00365E26ED
MAIIAMVSAKGSPGVSTAALACTLSWSRPTLLAECDPAGGDILAGYLSGLEIPPRGLLPLAVADLRGRAREEFPHQLVDLDAGDPGRRLVLPGITDPVQANTLRPTWERLATFFADLEHQDRGIDVIADCGRLTTSAAPWPLLHRADLILLVLRPATLRTISPALPAIAHLRRELTEHGRGPGALAMLTIGESTYPNRELEQRLQLPILASLPDDPRSAQVLSDGGRLRRNPELLRAAASIEPVASRTIAERRTRLSATAVPTEASNA